jgi:hypothetical protein
LSPKKLLKNRNKQLLLALTMKRVTAIFFVFIFLLQLAVSFSYVVWYEVNKTYVATELCENTDKPELHCDGKCYLKKKLSPAKEDSTKKQSTDTISFQLFFFNDVADISFYSGFDVLESGFLSKETIHISFGLAQPPELMV